MKILITGISGLLGSELAKAFDGEHEVFGLTQNSGLPGFKVHHCDISDQKSTYELVSKVNPDLVIHSAALSNVDECERNPTAAYRANALGTRNIAVACQRFDTVLMYISTDYVFSGKRFELEGYAEFDQTDPINSYAKSKLEGEWFVRHLLNRFYIIRTSWLFGTARPNLITQTAECFKEKKQVKAAYDMISAPTSVEDLSQAIMKLTAEPLYGIYHITNTGFVSRSDIAVQIAELMKVPKELVIQVTRAQLKLAAERPQFSGLKNQAWVNEGFEPLRPWQEAAREVLVRLKYIS
jgi:dTDP-4-dehydrorhamnose reductase